MVSLIQSEFKRRVFEESFDRIENCLERLSYEQVWHKPNSNTNSIGNLVLHLLGNVRQYICCGIGEQKDIRERSKEFLAESAVPSKELLHRLEALKGDVLQVIESLNETKLTKIYEVQGFSESGMSIVIHVIEHFSYHVGQIALYTKLLVDEDLGFYAGLDLEAKSS